MDNKIISTENRSSKIKNYRRVKSAPDSKKLDSGPSSKISEILLLSSYPPRECGIATYSKDLERALIGKFGDSFKLTICPLETTSERHDYGKDIPFSVKTDHVLDYIKVGHAINSDPNIGMVVVQHEFGLFRNSENDLVEFLEFLNKPIIITFHTVLPNPDPFLKQMVKRIASFCDAIIVMTHTSSNILANDYGISQEKLSVIPHGTHLVHYEDKKILKKKYGLDDKIVLSNFGLLGPGKSIETTLEALPGIVREFPKTIFLIIGKTHPNLIKLEGETYREFLERKVDTLGLRDHVRFINQFLPLEVLLEYLQLTDIYLFTSKDPNQAVSGTFSYALSCGCPIISTPIPHALEVLKNEAGVVFEFEDSDRLKQEVIHLLGDKEKRDLMSRNGLQTTAGTAWQNSAIAHAKIFESLDKNSFPLKYRRPPLNMGHIQKMTTEIGIVQFSKVNQPDLESGYTLDDNARAMIVMCQHYAMTNDRSDLKYIKTYFDFIFCCFRPDGKFLNYVDKEYCFTDQNRSENLEDANGRAVWALGYLLSMSDLLPDEYKSVENKALFLLKECLKEIEDIRSPRGMAFVIKGLYYLKKGRHVICINGLIKQFADRLTEMYKHNTTEGWHWFESYLTYGNSILPQALLMAYVMTLDPEYRKVAKESFDYLLSKIFIDDCIRVISNKNWLKKEDLFASDFKGGEQPIDVAYTILALRMFHKIFPNEGYDKKMETAFNWFLGENPLHQIIYNPCTGGCYDGLELHNVNLNQGAESMLSYLLARMAFEDNYGR